METKVYTNSSVNADFIYDDADDYQNEIAELYSYAEENDIKQNFCAFKIEVESSNLLPLEWRNWNLNNRCNFIMKIVDQLDNLNEQIRMRGIRCILYIAQGCWAEVRTIEEQQELTRQNIPLLYKAGVFQIIISLLNMELEKVSTTTTTTTHSSIEKATSNETDDIEIDTSTKDSICLKLLINILYTIIETIRNEKLNNNLQYNDIIEECISELSNPLADGILLPIKLFNMVIKFCDGTAAHFPIKKILLLLWKSSLMILGSTTELLALKNELRIKNDLKQIDDDTVEISKCMQPSIVSGEDISIPKRPNNTIKRNRALWKVICENVDNAGNTKSFEMSSNRLKQATNWNNDDETNDISETAMKYENLTRNLTQSQHNLLFFEPKVRVRDIQIFLQNARQKYFGYNLNDDNQTIIGLPIPIQESVHALRRHLYVSLADKQIEMEQKQCKHPFREEIIEQTSTELLYQTLLPNFRKYITDLLRIMLASSPSAKLTTGNLNSRVVADIMPKGSHNNNNNNNNDNNSNNNNNNNNSSVLTSIVQTDMIRHKEIIVKSITAILLIYLKHFKINHIYQFEYMSQLLAQSSFIKLTLQVFAPIIPDYVALKTTLPKYEFPLCAIETSSQDEYNTINDHYHHHQNLYGKNAITDFTYTWRNLFSCINLMRILNKLVKWKNSRILNMVSLKSTDALKEILQIQQPLLQIYVLKLLKMQTRYFGRYWRRNNLKVVTAIYTKVRHRFNDDWAYGCDTVAKFWNAQEEEFDLRMCVLRFHNRRYPNLILDSELNNNCPNLSDGNFKSNKATKLNDGYSIFNDKGADIFNGSIETELHREQCRNNLNKMEIENKKSNETELTEFFKENYETWLKNQVYAKKFNWDSI